MRGRIGRGREACAENARPGGVRRKCGGGERSRRVWKKLVVKKYEKTLAKRFRRSYTVSYRFAMRADSEFTRACTGFDGGLAAGEAIRRRCVKSQT